MKRFIPYLHLLREVRWPLAGAMLCALAYGVASGFSLPFAIEKIFPRIFADAGAEPVAPLGTTELVLYTLWLPAVFLVRGLGGYGNSYLIQLCGVRILEAIRTRYFSHLQRLPLAFFGRNAAGDLISRGMADTNQLQVTLTTFANEAFKQPVTLLSALGAILWLAFQNPDVWVILGGLALIPLTVFPIRFVGRKLLKRAREVQHEMGSVTAHFSENISAAREVRAFGLEDREIGRFSTTIRKLFRVQMKVVKYAQALSPTIEVISAVGIALTLVLAHRVDMPLSSFIALVGALYMSYEPVKKMGLISNELKRGEAALDRIEAILHEPITIADPQTPVAIERARGEVEFERVGFSYGDAPALEDVSVRIPAGTVCALVGPSGAGKSTFANLIPRFYDATSGAVKIDGIDVRRLRLADLRRQIAVVPQDSLLFNETILANILVGRPTASREEAEAAARDAFIHDFIVSQPNGYDTIVGERGASLSGGQRQRLALARAFLRDAPILVLDEATSALDAESEVMVQRALQRLVVGKTVFIVAHRFSTIRDANLILVFDRGRIVASGDHASLHRDDATYRGLYDRQR
ncbi:lipid A export permease/ATP-binding protein MsbA [Opitutales bacterium ASA1]|uniref:ABC transporter ATP-binding protein n=1 Tax=Congregicoccus parvus TaxID=3081749 RepID=UPI002B2B5B23|nr:lipid A export permease/ATP-binding protein MsbA [Opitutales bacterium ASA1]